MMNNVRIGIMPVETAGYVQGLEWGLRAMGFNVRAVSIEKHPMKYSQLAKNPIWSIWLSSVTQAMNNRPIFFPILYLVGLLLRVWGSLWVTLKFDYLVLNNGRSLLPLHLDLTLYRLAGIKIFAMMGHGSEIRPACLDSLGSNSKFTPQEQRKIYRRCFSRRNYVRRVESLAHLVISTPALSHYLRRNYVNGNLLGIPVFNPLELIDELPSSIIDNSSAKPRVVHIPSEPVLKGTEAITEICEKLVEEGLIEFVSKTRVTHNEALALLASSDLLVDQLYSDVYMPVLATEAAFLSKPAIVAGYAWAYLRETSSKPTQPPVINIDPKDLEATIRNLVLSPEGLKLLGQQAKDFVVTRRNPLAVAEKYSRLFSGDQEYLSQISLKPGLPKYAWGCGSSREAIIALARASDVPHTCF